jgi:phytanoyl-CoA hydroxylase
MKVYDGLTEYVASVEEAERVRRTLYRTDASARATVLATYRAPLEPADLRRFAERGYFAMEGVLTGEEVLRCAAALDELARRRPTGVGVQEEPYYQQGGGRQGGGPRDGQEPAPAAPELRVRKLWKFADAAPVLGALVAASRITAVLDQLVGPGARLIQDMALMKPPYRGAEKPWHQDNAYFDWAPLDGVIGVWIALDPATVENGCMQVVPGSHRAGPAPHYHVRDCQLVDQASRAEGAEVVPLGPGGALFFSALLHHGTPPNRSADRRRALQFHYAAARCTRMTFREHMAHFDVGGAYVGCRDWDMDAGVSRARLSP